MDTWNDDINFCSNSCLCGEVVNGAQGGSKAPSPQTNHPVDARSAIPCTPGDPFDARRELPAYF